MPPRKKAQRILPRHIGLPAVDALAGKTSPALHDYITAVSEYVRESGRLTVANSKAAQILLSSALGRCLCEALAAANPRIQPIAGELTVSGALRTARADVSESHELDGLRLAVEIKPVNLAVGRAIWNRFGDVRAFAVNIHLKFPFAVVGGVLVLPTWEWAKPTRTAERTIPMDKADTDLDLSGAADAESEDQVAEPIAANVPPGHLYKKPTTPLLDRLVRRLQRTRLRETEADAAHLLEAIAVLIYDPDTSTLVPDLPPPGTGLRWEEFIATMAETYELRFEE